MVEIRALKAYQTWIPETRVRPKPRCASSFAGWRLLRFIRTVTRNFKCDGAGVTSPVLDDGAAAYTPGISERRGSTTTYLHSGLKNAEVQTGTGNTISAERTYDAFGNLTASTGTWQGPFGYQEDASGLQLLGHRYYDPSLGRFLTRDPILHGRNWYTYCQNNPVSYADIDGQIPVLVVVAVAAVVIAIWPTPAHAPSSPTDAGDISSGDEGKWLILDVADIVLSLCTGKVPARFPGGGLARRTGGAASKPRPFRPGKRGGPEHRRAVEETERAYLDAGYRHISGGSKSEKMVNGRYPDLHFKAPDGTDSYVQVGRGRVGAGLGEFGWDPDTTGSMPR